MELELGYTKGEPCNRGGCKGVLEEHPTDTSCSCHINPPCSHCTTDRTFCRVCEWDGGEEQHEGELAQLASITDEQKEAWAKQQKEWEDYRNNFYKLFHSSEVATETKYRTESHTHFSQKVFGIFPPNSDIDMDKIRGTFGGRFERLDTQRGRFIYIAYTD